MFDLTPDPIAFSIGPIDVFWYGIAYAGGLVAVYALLVRLAVRAGRRPLPRAGVPHVGNHGGARVPGRQERAT